MKKTLSILIGLFLPFTVLSQQVDSLLQQRGFTGAITVTNNGVSLIPTFTLGKPAVFFDVAVRKKRFSFEPQLTFALQDPSPGTLSSGCGISSSTRQNFAWVLVLTPR